MKDGSYDRIIKDKKDAKYVPMYHKPFEERIEELKNLSLKFRGSSNQRVIDLKQTLKTNEIKLLEQ